MSFSTILGGQLCFGWDITGPLNVVPPPPPLTTATLRHFHFCTMNALELLPRGVVQKDHWKSLLILLMMSCPSKSRHLHPQMDEYGGGAPQGLRSSQPPRPSAGSHFLWNEAGQLALKVEFVDREGRGESNATYHTVIIVGVDKLAGIYD